MSFGTYLSTILGASTFELAAVAGMGGNGWCGDLQVNFDALSVSCRVVLFFFDCLLLALGGLFGFGSCIKLQAAFRLLTCQCPGRKGEKRKSEWLGLEEDGK